MAVKPMVAPPAEILKAIQIYYFGNKPRPQASLGPPQMTEPAPPRTSLKPQTVRIVERATLDSPCRSDSAGTPAGGPSDLAQRKPRWPHSQRVGTPQSLREREASDDHADAPRRHEGQPSDPGQSGARHGAGDAYRE